MEISYYGHSTFKLKGKAGSVVTDPFDNYIGLTLPTLSADIVTVSHDHKDHNATIKVKGTTRREKPFIVDQAGEYEVGDISIFGTKTFHDETEGSKRGENTVFTIMLDEITVCHLGDLGHELTSEQISEIGAVDVVLCPVGGVFTIDPALAAKTIRSLEPSIAIPMHYKTAAHNQDIFGEVKELSDFLKVYGVETAPIERLKLEKDRLPEETELVVLSISL